MSSRDLSTGSGGQQGAEADGGVRERHSSHRVSCRGAQVGPEILRQCKFTKNVLTQVRGGVIQCANPQIRPRRADPGATHRSDFLRSEKK